MISKNYKSPGKMMERIVILLTFLIGITIRFYVLSISRKTKVYEIFKEGLSNFLIGLNLIFAYILMLIYPFYPKFFDAAYWGKNIFLLYLGLFLLVIHIYLFFKSHKDLGVFWSGGISIKNNHKLITSGIYSRIRHPMYMAGFFLTLGVNLVTQNLFFIVLLPFSVGMLLRIKKEESFLEKHFGIEYLNYKKNTPRFFNLPALFKYFWS